MSKLSSIVHYRPKPSLSVDAKDLPAIKGWKIGKTYTLTVQAKMVEIDSGDEYDDMNEDNHRPIHARFRITKVSEQGE